MATIEDTCLTALSLQATRLTIHILAAVAEHEREMISARTKAKRRGKVLGNPRLAEATAKAHTAHRANRPAPDVLKLMMDWRQLGQTEIHLTKAGESYTQIVQQVLEAEMAD